MSDVQSIILAIFIIFVGILATLWIMASTLEDMLSELSKSIHDRFHTIEQLLDKSKDKKQ